MFLMIALGYFTTMMASGFVSSRLDQRRTIVVSALSLSAALLLTGFAGGLWSLRGAFILVGLAAGLYLPSGIATITSLAPQKSWGKALAIHEMAPNLAFLMAPVIAEVLIHWLSWRRIEMLLGLLTLTAALAFARFGKGGRFKGRAPNPEVIRMLIRQRNFWIMMGLFSLGVSGTMGVYNMMTLYLVQESELTRSGANALLSASRISGLFMAFAAGWAADRLGPKRALKVILSCSGAATLSLGFLTGLGLMVAVFLQAALAAAYFPAGFSALGRIGRPEERSVVVSLAVPLAYVMGGGVLPTVIGVMGEHVSFAAGMTLAGVVILSGPVLVRFLHFKE
jgi:NNP family nitrate/nitrite transporter-like MFS transporter